MKIVKTLKIISFYSNEKVLIQKAAAGNREAQRRIFDQYAPKMLGVCKQYIRDLQFAEDVMITGFVKIFSHLGNFRHEGSFEGWIRRIMVRDAISSLRKRQFVVFDDEIIVKNMPSPEIEGTSLDVERVQHIIDSLPDGYKMVFVLYAVEGYTHAEIARLLDISENTSKSQLFKARQQLQQKIGSMENMGRMTTGKG